MSLSQVLGRLIGQARPGRAAAHSLKSGLRVSVRVLPGGARQMSLTRTATQKPAWKEAELCAEHAGWANALIETGQTRAGLPCLLVTGGDGVMTPPPIRGLTLRHPWPRMFLLDDEPKRIENRDWAPPKAMLGGLIALHGGLPPKPSDREYLKEIRGALSWVGDIFDDPDPVDVFTDEQLLSEFCVSGIYGVARLADVVTVSDDPWFAGPFGWVLQDFVAIDPPLPDRSPSHRGLWTIEDGTLAELRGRYLAVTRPALALAPVPLRDTGLDILARVDARRPLAHADGDAVRALIAQGQLHVTPEFDRTDPCPYRLTEAGRQALAQGVRQP